MITRNLEYNLINSLKNVPVVALLEPRQVGKTTLALQIAEQTLGKKSSYLDLELDSDLSKLDDIESYLFSYYVIKIKYTRVYNESDRCF